MSDRINTITVVLERSIRDDDCEPILKTISMIKGVLSAKANVANATEYMDETRARNELGDKLFSIIYPNFPK